MSRVLTINRNARKRTVGASLNCSVFSMRENAMAKRAVSQNCRGSVTFSPKSVMVLLVFMIFAFGSFYLYQVNDLATKGYEIRDIENQIKKLKADNEKNKIQEVELKSMQNIEKAAEDLNLVSSKGSTFINLKGPVAMK
ncbi:MAG: hypothetical protein WA055_01800 [Candidatus Moraniibacteriota bacterium]